MIQQEYTEFKATARKRINADLVLSYSFIQRRRADTNEVKIKSSKLAKNRAKLQKQQIEAINTAAVQKALTREQQCRNRAKAKERKERYLK